MIGKQLTEHHLEFLRLQRLVRVYTCQNATLLETSCSGSFRSMPRFSGATFSVSVLKSLKFVAQPAGLRVVLSD